MKLIRQDVKKPDFEKLNKSIRLMTDFLEGSEAEFSLKELILFQDGRGSFSLFETYELPNEAVIDYINIPTYICTAALMKEYLNGNGNVKDSLVKGLRFTKSTGFRGHGYDSERLLIKAVEIFIKGGLTTFLEEERYLYPGFNKLVHNIVHKYNSNLIKGNTFGLWGEDYKKDWKEIVGKLKLQRRLYLAYGSNMNKDQMKRRCQHASIIGKTYLEDWQLTLPHFANIEKKKGQRTPALIWEITDKDERELDRCEGYPSCYDKREFLVDLDGKETTAMAYIMTDEYKNINKPTRKGYVEAIMQGYADAGFEHGDGSLFDKL